MLNKKEYTIQTTFYTKGVLVKSTKDIIPIETEVSKLVRDIKMKISELRKCNVKKDETVMFHPEKTYSYKVVNDFKLKPIGTEHYSKNAQTSFYKEYQLVLHL